MIFLNLLKFQNLIPKKYQISEKKNQQKRADIADITKQ